MFREELRHAEIKRHGVAFKYGGVRLPGLTKQVLRDRYYPHFNRVEAVRAGHRDPGKGLRWSGVGPRKPQSARGLAMQKRIGKGMQRGNALNKQIAEMVTLMHRFGVPLERFTASYRATRRPKVMTEKRLLKDFPLLEGHEKVCLSLLNSARPHLPLFAQKIKELDIRLDAYEWPVVHPGVGLTAVDVTGTHKDTRVRVVMEVKTSNGGYLFDAHGRLRAPFQQFDACALNFWRLQLAYTNDWARRSYPGETLAVPLLIVVTPNDCFHSALPAEMRQPPPLPPIQTRTSEPAERKATKRKRPE